MTEYITPILQWINAHPQLAGLATFIISAAESIAIIGTIIPGTVMMTAIGALAGSGVMPLSSTIMWAILGAIVGDGISYWIGYYFKDRLHYVWPFRKYPNLLETGERFFRKHGGKSVFIGRFVGPVRALVPLIAGMLRMKPLHFIFANVVSAIGWAPAYMLPGIALGAASLELPPDIAAHAILMILLIMLFIIFCLWMIKKIFSLIGTQINQGLTRIWYKLQMSRHFSLITTALKHHNPSKTYGQLTLVFYFIVTSMLFVYLAAYVYLHGPQNIFINNSFFYLLRSLRTTTGQSIMSAITILGESVTLLPLAIAFFLWFGRTKRWRLACHALALGILVSVGVEVFKHVIHSYRPWGILHSPTSFSFPSGHSTFTTAFFSALALLLVKASKQKFRRTIYGITAIIIFTICVSRMYLGAHWFTDVIGGVLFGSAILMLVIISYNRKAEKPVKPFEIIALTFLTLLVSYSFQFFHSYEKTKAASTLIDWPTRTVTLDNWWNRKGKNLPLYRLNRFGLASQILTLQWLGNLEDIKTILLNNGWEVAQSWDWIAALHRISNVESTEHLPLVSPLYFDKTPILVVIRTMPGSKKLIVLRLWQPYVKIENVNQPLWVGTVELVPSTYSWLFKPRRTNDVDLSAKQLFSTLPQNYDIKTISVLNTHHRHNEKQTMLLIKPKSI